MEFGSLDNRVDDEHNGVGFVEISNDLRCRTHFSLGQNLLTVYMWLTKVVFGGKMSISSHQRMGASSYWLVITLDRSPGKLHQQLL